jgi:hypothetical protein
MTDTVLKTRARWWTAAFLVATFGSAALVAAGVLHGWFGRGLFVASFLLLWPMTRAVNEAQAACGAGSPASRAYGRRMLVASFAYILLFLGGMSVVRATDPSVAIRVAFALLAALPVIGMIRAMALLLKEERDEYLRQRFVEQSLVGTGLLLTVATLYGFLNAFDVAPRIDAWAAFPVWAIGLGLGRLVRRDGGC